MNGNELYLVVTTFIPKTDVPSTAVSNILENEVDAWSYIDQQVDELSKKDKNPIVVINQFRKKVVVSIGNNHGSNYPHPTPSIFIFSIHKTHYFKLTSDKN